jgi:hypothetical protein
VNTDTRADRFEQRLLAAILDDFPNLAGAEARGVRPRESLRPAGSGTSRKRGALVVLAAGAAAAAGVAGVVGGADMPSRSAPASRSTPAFRLTCRLTTWWTTSRPR